MLVFLKSDRVTVLTGLGLDWVWTWSGLGLDAVACAGPCSLWLKHVLDQFIQQSAYAVVLLRRARHGLVTHGTHTTDLQPLHQTLPVEGVLAWQHPQLIFDFEVLQTHGTRLPMEVQLLRVTFQNHLSVAKALTLGLVSEFADEVAAEDEAQDEDEDARAEDDHVDVKREVLEGDGRHRA